MIKAMPETVSVVTKSGGGKGDFDVYPPGGFPANKSNDSQGMPQPQQNQQPDKQPHHHQPFQGQQQQQQQQQQGPMSQGPPPVIQQPQQPMGDGPPPEMLASYLLHQVRTQVLTHKVNKTLFHSRTVNCTLRLFSHTPSTTFRGWSKSDGSSQTLALYSIQVHPADFLRWAGRACAAPHADPGLPVQGLDANGDGGTGRRSKRSSCTRRGVKAQTLISDTLTLKESAMGKQALNPEFRSMATHDQHLQILGAKSQAPVVLFPQSASKAPSPSCR